MPAAKRVLYHGPSVGAFHELVDAQARSPGCERLGVDPPILAHEGATCLWVPALTAEELHRHLAHEYVNLVILDLRGPEETLAARGAAARATLEQLDRTDDVEDRFAFDHILVLIPGGATPALDALLLELGALGVRRVLRDLGPDFGASLGAEIRSVLFGRRPGKRALCAAGGGITGLYFELGALKCLDDALPGGGVNEFDLYFGISAGAVATGPIAAGYSVDEYMAAIAGVEGGRIPPLDLRLLRLGHLNARGFARRTSAALRTTAGGLFSALTGRTPPTQESLAFEYADLVLPPFTGDGFERMLRQILTAPGATNDFRNLPRPLFVGATDQDQREHVLFGDEHHDAVPISLAIQASLSFNPAFSATRIGGRYYEDGAVTRTSNFVEAMRRGATLILVLDPFVPYVARTPGFSSQRGVLFNIDQDVRTISYTRYENTRNWVLRKRPDVSAYTFVPANRVRRLMAVNPMDHRPYREIWRGGYLSMLARLRRLEHRLGGDFAAHGARLDLARPGEVGERLEATPLPELADFFPDRRVVLRRPPLCLDGRGRGVVAAEPG